MPLNHTPDLNVPYYLISFDAEGIECDDDDSADGSGHFSTVVLDQLSKHKYSDVFIVSHGWRADRDGAINQYDRWVNAMKGMRPTSSLGEDMLVIALHWPSEPFGDEGDSDLYHFVKTSPYGISQAVGKWKKRFDQGFQKLESKMNNIFALAGRDGMPTGANTNQFRSAYQNLDKELNFGSAGVTPRDDRVPFNQNDMWELSNKKFGEYARDSDEKLRELAVWNAVLLPLRVLSVWSMKSRALSVGENGPRKLLSAIQETLKGQETKIHLSGHSFGTIVISAMAFGNNIGFPVSPVSSIVLLQGAVSVWSYAKNIPYKPEIPGYFFDGYQRTKPLGPIVITSSDKDRANCWWYPIAAAMAQQVTINKETPIAPKYGALGQFGAWDGEAQASPITVQAQYNFAPGQLHSVDCSSVIKEGGGFSGAHNDIAHDEIAELVWQAAGHN